MEMQSNKVNMKIIKIVAFQIIMNIERDKSNLSIVDLLTSSMFNIYKYQIQRCDSKKIIEIKFLYIKKIWKQLFQSCSNDDEYYKLFEILMIKTCEYMKIYISLTVPDELLFKSKEKAYITLYLMNRILFKYDHSKRAIIRGYLKENKYSEGCFKQLIKMFFRLIDEFKFNDNTPFDDRYSDLQIFIESSLIIINDQYLLKSFKKLKLDWIHKSWQQVPKSIS